MPILRTRKCLLVAILIFATASKAVAESASICEEVRDVIKHPAQYAAKLIQQCTANPLILATPQCCLPGWQLRPECYITKQVQVSDAWEELTTSVKCTEGDLRDIAENLISYWYLGTIQAIIGLPQLLNELIALIALATAPSETLPHDVSAKLNTWAQARLVRFDVPDVGRARWISDSNELAKTIKPVIKGKDSITWDHLIVVGPGLRNAQGCLRMALWAHEIQHVSQYRIKGFSRFVKEYLEDFKNVGDYNKLLVEVEAVETEHKVLSLCQAESQVVRTHYQAILGREPTSEEVDSEVNSSTDSQHAQLALGLAEKRMQTLQDLTAKQLTKIQALVPELTAAQEEWEDESRSDACKLVRKSEDRTLGANDAWINCVTMEIVPKELEKQVSALLTRYATPSEEAASLLKTQAELITYLRSHKLDATNFQTRLSNQDRLFRDAQVIADQLKAYRDQNTKRRKEITETIRGIRSGAKALATFPGTLPETKIFEQNNMIIIQEKKSINSFR